MNLKKKRFHPLTKLVVVLFFFGFDGLAREGHGFLCPSFLFLPMSSCKEVFSSILLALVRCFFFSNLGWIILFNIFFRFNTIFSLSIRGRYAVWINSRFFFFYGIIGIVRFLVFLFLLLLLWRANNFFFLHLRILPDPLWMPFWIERVLGVCSTPCLYTISL